MEYLIAILCDKEERVDEMKKAAILPCLCDIREGWKAFPVAGCHLLARFSVLSWGHMKHHRSATVTSVETYTHKQSLTEVK